MQIDFHHAVTYVVARLAGFSPAEADIVVYSAQYVDDATDEGIIEFSSGALFHRISSAHKMLDYRNSEELGNHRVWLPFHFLPGNDGLPAGANPDGSFINKIICRPNSHVARDMVRDCIDQSHRPYALHRLGITMHVYADTWAHQGFAGVNHKINEASSLVSNDSDFDIRFTDKIVNFFIDKAFPLGHGTVLSYPDQPHLKWEYNNAYGRLIVRDNPADFIDAAGHMYHVMRAYREGVSLPDFDRIGRIPDVDRDTMIRFLQNTTSKEGEKRHRVWLDAVGIGEFSFGAETVHYDPDEKLWKTQALGGKKWTGQLPYSEDFLHSNWKLFHDALLAHRFAIIHEILPQYGICAA